MISGSKQEKEDKGVRLCMLTWNVGGKKPPAQMEDALRLTQAPLPDLFGIGLQEVSPKPSDSKEWVDMFTWTLADYDFVRVKYRQQLGVITLVFVLRPLLPYCTSFESEITKTGMGGWWGNKGGVSIRLDILGINLIIVNCHLAAHQEHVAERIEDYDSILDDQKFKDPDVENILDHDYVFWMGDLNFRIDNMSRGEVERAISSGGLRKLLENDQLNRCREEKLIFEDFEEMEIKFPPTYKFDPGTDTYDTSSKQRIPAWCDRVLWHYENTDYDGFQLRVDPIEYTSHPKYRLSDHKPVTGMFFFTVFPKPPMNPVQFETQKNWRRDRSTTVRYCVNKHSKTSDSDWIGLYKADFHQFDKYVSYTWAQQGAENNRQGVSVTFSSRSLTVKPGLYCLCYLTRRYSLMGISNNFVII
ncbi:phosphatidylinositol 4,5-bisphosphate 5-phosphatase A-like [Babylonia areolata]|uniref:phosphatidylinositol 4,5-bisphosphate 5-phosphatase A-like n=1 Tax=Babylonia areolata TaxID=304850 RepID=UPI003FD476CF